MQKKTKVSIAEVVGFLDPVDVSEEQGAGSGPGQLGGCGSGFGSGRGSESGEGYGDGEDCSDGHGSGDGSGYGYDDGTGYGRGGNQAGCRVVSCSSGSCDFIPAYEPVCSSDFAGGSGFGKGPGSGDGCGSGDGYGRGDGSGYGDVYGCGSGDGYGSGDGSGYGSGSGCGRGDDQTGCRVVLSSPGSCDPSARTGARDRFDDGDCAGSGSGDGSGFGSGWGSGYGEGSGDCEGYNDGHGSSSGDGHGYGSSSGSGTGYGSGDGYGSGAGRGIGAVAMGRSGSGTLITPGDVFEINGELVWDVDGVPTVIWQVKGRFAKGAILHDDLWLEPCWIVRSGRSFAHGATLAKAERDARIKSLKERPVSERIKEFKTRFPAFDQEVDGKVLFSWHGILTGSCEMGRRSWCQDNGLSPRKDKLTVREFCRRTKNAYGGDVIRKLEKAYCGKH